MKVNNIFRGHKKKKAPTLYEEPIEEHKVPPFVEERRSTPITVVDTNNLPVALSQQFEQMSILERKMKDAQACADIAKNAAFALRGKKSFFYSRRKAIHALQESTFAFAQAQSDMLDAMRASFIFQQGISSIVNQLFMHSNNNLAETRVLMDKLQAELKRINTEGSFSDSTKAEMQKIIQQLKEREDFMSKQAKQSEVLQQHGQDIKAFHDFQYQTITDISLAQQAASEQHKIIADLQEQLTQSQLEQKNMTKMMMITAGVAAISLISVLIGFIF